MKSTFGSNDCRLLYLNSSQDGLVEHEDNPWAPYVSQILRTIFFQFPVIMFFNFILNTVKIGEFEAINFCHCHRKVMLQLASPLAVLLISMITMR